MLQGIAETAQATLTLIEKIRVLMAEYKQRIRDDHSKIYSQDLLNNLFRHPYTRIDYVQDELGVSRPTATKYLDELAQDGLLNKHRIGRNNYYINQRLAALFVEGAVFGPNGWRESVWGDEISLEYGKGIRGYADASGPYRVFGSNGAVGWAEKPLTQGPGVILGRKSAYRGVRWSDEPFHVIDTAYYIKLKTDLDMRWVYYAVIHHKLGEIDDGSPIPSTTRAAVYVREVSVPSIDEQQAIAAVLSALDDKIELNRQMNETLEARRVRCSGTGLSISAP